MSLIYFEAEERKVMGKGASRRLRRLENKVPAILYGGDKEPQPILLLHNKVLKALENEAIYSSIFDIKLNGHIEHVILKDLQRHPYRSIILHMDLLRVSAKDVIVKPVPLHFINEEQAKGVKRGGIVNHITTQVDVRCQAKDLPEFIEVDIAQVDLDQTLHFSDLKLPKGVQLTANLAESNNNLPVVSIHTPKGGLAEKSANEVEITE